MKPSILRTIQGDNDINLYIEAEKEFGESASVITLNEGNTRTFYFVGLTSEGDGSEEQLPSCLRDVDFSTFQLGKRYWLYESVLSEYKPIRASNRVVAPNLLRDMCLALFPFMSGSEPVNQTGKVEFKRASEGDNEPFSKVLDGYRELMKEAGNSAKPIVLHEHHKGDDSENLVQALKDNNGLYFLLVTSGAETTYVMKYTFKECVPELPDELKGLELRGLRLGETYYIDNDGHVKPTGN